MSTYTQLIYHIVYSIKNRNPALDEPHRKRLFKYLWGILKNNKCHLYRIYGVEDHLHLLTHIHPTVALSNLVKDLKVSSNNFIKDHDIFAGFDGWQQGYGAFTHSFKEKDRLIKYIKNQKEHHRRITFRAEYKALLNEHGIAFKDEYLL